MNVEKSRIERTTVKSMLNSRLLYLVASVALLIGGESSAAERHAIKAGKIITISGAPIENGVILIENGRIKDVGTDIEIPFDAMVIDASDQVVFPALIEAHTQIGLYRPNETLPITPFVNVYDVIDPSSYGFEDALRDGIGAMAIIQGNSQSIAGMGRVVAPHGMTVEAMTLREETGLKISMSPRRGASHMVHLASLRAEFSKLDDHMRSLAESKWAEKLAKDTGDDEVHYDPKEAREKGAALIEDSDVSDQFYNLLRLTRGEIQAYVYCAQAMDVAHAIKLARERGFLSQMNLLVGAECHKAADLIKEAGRPVILGPTLFHRERDPVTLEEKEVFLPAVYAEKGIPFTFARSTRGELAEGHFWYQGAIAVREGLSREQALRAMTLSAAEIIGMGSELGSIEKGKIANLAILSGDPLSAMTWVDRVLIRGEVVYRRSEDERLKELLHDVASLKAKDEGGKAEEAAPPATDAKEAPKAEAGEGDAAKKKAGENKEGANKEGKKDS